MEATFEGGQGPEGAAVPWMGGIVAVATNSLVFRLNITKIKSFAFCLDASTSRIIIVFSMSAAVSCSLLEGRRH
jgi:hypothetical protein